jgi:shikimate 5-dehydrogenase
MSEPKPQAEGNRALDAKSALLRWGSGGAAAAVIYQLFELVAGNEALIAQVLNWGPLFVIVVVGMLIVDRRMGQNVEVNRRTAEATAQLAAAVQHLSEKDDRRAQATDAAIGFVAQQGEQILAKLNAIEERLPKT